MFAVAYSATAPRLCEVTWNGDTMQTNFPGFSPDALKFFVQLKRHNRRPWFLKNKGTYEREIKEPMVSLVLALNAEFRSLAPELITEPKRAIYRIYRDVRFSADKSPYKTSIAAMVGEGYVQLSAEGLAAGCGMWEMASDQLERYRQAVADDKSGRVLEGIASKARAAGLEVMGHEVLKTAPKGYPKDHPRIELLRYKGLVAWKQWPPAAWLGTRRAKDRVVEFLQLSRPLAEWLNARVA